MSPDSVSSKSLILKKLGKTKRLEVEVWQHLPQRGDESPFKRGTRCVAQGDWPLRRLNKVKKSELTRFTVDFDHPDRRFKKIEPVNGSIMLKLAWRFANDGVSQLRAAEEQESTSKEQSSTSMQSGDLAKGQARCTDSANSKDHKPTTSLGVERKTPDAPSQPRLRIKTHPALAGRHVLNLQGPLASFGGGVNVGVGAGDRNKRVTQAFPRQLVPPNIGLVEAAAETGGGETKAPKEGAPKTQKMASRMAEGVVERLASKQADKVFFSQDGKLGFGTET